MGAGTISPWYVAGYDLESILNDYQARGAFLPTSTAVTIVQRLAGGLAALHGHGVVHRDIKPSNVMIAFDTRGLAAAVRSAPTSFTWRVLVVDAESTLHHVVKRTSSCSISTFPTSTAPRRCR